MYKNKYEMKMNQVSVEGRHIQYILENVFGQKIISEDKGHPLKQDEKKLYKLSDGIITTSGTPYIEISFYWKYILTVTDNIFTFAIHNRVSENHIMKALTYDQQEEILIYCGFKNPVKKCCECNDYFDIDDIVRLQKKPEIWICCGCNYKKVMDEYDYDSEEELCICEKDENDFVELSNPLCNQHNCCKDCSKGIKTILSSDGFWKCDECNK